MTPHGANPLQRHIGRFKDALAAARAYDRAAYFLYGQKAVLNFSSEEAAADQGGVPLFIRHAKEQAGANIAACCAESSSTVPASSSSSSSVSDGFGTSSPTPCAASADADPAWQLLQQHREQQPPTQMLEQMQLLPTHHQQQQQQLCVFDASVLPVVCQVSPVQPAGALALQLQCWPMNLCPCQPAPGPTAAVSVAPLTGQLGALSGTSVTCGATSSCSSSLLNPVQLASCGLLPGSTVGSSTMLPIAVAAAATGPMQAAPFLGAQHASAAAAAGASHGGPVFTSSSSSSAVAQAAATERQVLHQLLELQLQKQPPLQQTLTWPQQQQQQQQQAPAASGVQLLHVPPRPLLMQHVHAGPVQQHTKLLQAPVVLNGTSDSLQLQHHSSRHLQLQAPSMLAHSSSTGTDGLFQAGVLGAGQQQQQLLHSPAVAVAHATELQHAVVQQQLQLQHYQQNAPVGVLTGVLQGGALLQL